MALMKAFRAIRPHKDLTEQIAALPYDVYSRKEAYELVKDDRYTFLRIDRPETQFAPDFDMYSVPVYEKAHELLWDMVSNGEFVKDTQDSYYIYELTMDGRVQTGLVACASVDDYLNNTIKKHENTRADKEIDRINHVDYCNAQTGPIFLAYRYHEGLHGIIQKNKHTDPIFDFTSSDGIRHRGWQITEEADISKITEIFAGISEIYIADGHHRAASAVKVSLKRRSEETGLSPTSREYDFFLSVLFADSELCIMDYNRYVHDLNGFSCEEFLNHVAEICFISEPQKEPVHPKRKNTCGMYLDGNWYELTFKDQFCNDHPVSGLDVSILQDEILDPFLNIRNPKTDTRISFIGGIRGLCELEKLVNAGGGVAFSMYPTSMKELFQVADAGLLMPPKSTWFEPKLRSGLFIHGLD